MSLVFGSPLRQGPARRGSVRRRMAWVIACAACLVGLGWDAAHVFGMTVAGMTGPGMTWRAPGGGWPSGARAGEVETASPETTSPETTPPEAEGDPERPNREGEAARPAGAVDWAARYADGRHAVALVRFTLGTPQDSEWGTHIGILLNRETGLLVTPGMQREGTTLESVRVRFPKHERFLEARRVGRDEVTALAFLRVDPEDLPEEARAVALPEAERAAPRVGEPVALIGLFDNGSSYESYLGPGLVISAPGAPRPYLITNIHSDLYCGGAPLLDRHGVAVGVALPAQIEREYGAAFDSVRALPMATVLALAARPPRQEDGAAPPGPWLGVVLGPMSQELARHLRVEEGGAQVTRVLEGSPAAAAGILPGDLIVRFADQPVHARHDGEIQRFVERVRARAVDETVPVRILRDHTLHPERPGDDAARARPGRFRVHDLHLTLRARPEREGPRAHHRDERIGLVLAPVTLADRIDLDLKQDARGLRVIEVEEGSLASLAGLQEGDLIQRVGRDAVATVPEYEGAIRKALLAPKPGVPIFLRRGGGTLFRVLRPRADEAP